MASRPRFNKKEVEIRVRPNRRGDQRRPLVPWWMRLEKRHLIAKRAQVRGKRGRNIRTQGGAYQRRSVVKVMYTRNGKPRSNAWAAHARYLTREGAQLENEKGVGFDVERDGIDMVAVVREWEKAGDERMWRIIVSPEDADRMDLKDHIRDLVEAMESDLGTGLEWVAIDHHNTENPHAHLLRARRRSERQSTADRSGLCEERHPRAQPGDREPRARTASRTGNAPRSRRDD